MNRLADVNAIKLSKLIAKEEHEMTTWDITNLLNEEVSTNLTKLYKMVIIMLSNGYSYESIINMIDNYNEFDDEELLHEQKVYVKERVKKDINRRKVNIRREENE